MRTRNGSWLVFDIAKPLANALENFFHPSLFTLQRGRIDPARSRHTDLTDGAHGIEIDLASFIRFTCATSLTARRFPHRRRKGSAHDPARGASTATVAQPYMSRSSGVCRDPAHFCRKVGSDTRDGTSESSSRRHLTPFARLSFPWRLQHDKSAPTPLTGHQRALLLSGASTDY